MQWLLDQVAPVRRDQLHPVELDCRPDLHLATQLGEDIAARRVGLPAPTVQLALFAQRRASFTPVLC
jgi:hypothetical protein